MIDAQESPYLHSIRPKPIGKSRSSSEEDENGEESKENYFIVPETPKSTRGKRPPTYGRSSPQSSQRKRRGKHTPPPMSHILAASVEKTKLPSSMYRVVIQISY